MEMQGGGIMKNLGFALLAALLVLGSVQMLRGETTQPLLGESYLHLSGNPDAPNSPLRFVLEYFEMGTQGALTLSISLIIVSVFLVWLILDRLEIKGDLHLLTLLMWVLSPVFLHAGYVANGIALVIVFQLTGFLLLTYKHWGYHVGAVLCFLASSYHSLWHIWITIGVIAYLYLQRREASFIWQAFALIIIGTILHLRRFIEWFPQEHITLVSQGSWVSDFGGLGGVGIFTAVIGLFGFWYLQKRWFGVGLVLLGISLLERSVLWYVGLLMGYAAAITIEQLRKSKWALPELKQITLLLIVCGIIFSPLSYAREMADFGPSDNVFDVMTHIKQRTPQGAIVFTAPSNGRYVQSLGRRDIIAAETYHGADGELRVNMTEFVLHTYNLPGALDALEVWNVTHVLITPDMVGTIWDEPDKEFNYLLNNKEHFKPLYDEGGYRLYSIK